MTWILFRPLEQPQRTQRRFVHRARRPDGLRGGGQTILRRRRHHRTLGNMGVLRQVHDHASAADARGDAVDQGRQFVIVVDIGIEIALLLHDGFGATCGQANEIEPETGIERIVQGIEPFAKQAVDHLAFGHGLSGVNAIARTTPSVRKKWASSRRAPLPCCAIAATSMPASRDNVADITVSVATGSANRFSTM